MISVELWRARIGLFNSKHYSGFLSSLFSSYIPFKFRRRRKRNAVQEPPPTAATCTRPAVTQEEPPSTSASDLSRKLSPEADEKPSTIQQFFHSFSTFSWSSLLPTSFPRGLLSGCLLREALVRLVLLLAIISQVLIISGDVETNPGPDPTTPTLLGLDEMNGVDGNPLDIIQKIAAGNYERFGLHLLRDDNGEKVGLLKQNHTNDSERVTFEILKQWLRSDTTPRTYQHLIKCVRKSGLGALATSIENTIEQDQPPPAAAAAAESSSDSSGSVQPQPQLETVTRKSHPEEKDDDDQVSSPPAKKPRTSDPGTSQSKPPMIFQHTMKQAGEINIMQKADTKTKKEQAKQKQKLKEFQFKVMTYFQEQQEKEAQQNTPLPFQPTKYADLELMEIFRKYLEHVYQQRKKSVNFLEVLPLDSSDEEFISLCLIDSYDSSNKKKIRLCDLGKIIKEGRKYSSTKPAKGMLVEGAAGMGKSTFAWKCCQKWANGELLQDWSILIFIQLCNQRVREASILSDFIYYPEQAVREKICQKLVALKGRKVLFVVDSFDQVNEQQMDGTVFQQLVDNKLLPYATLIVLSRPMKSWRDKTLLGLVSKLGIDQHIKISGFNIDHYIASACNNELLAALESYLSSHPLIYSQMCISVHCVVITDLFCLHWNHGDKNFSPSTLTELYTDLVRTLLLRYLSNHREYSQREWVIEEFTDLPNKAKESFMALAQLAAKGIEERKYVFDKPTDFETLDMIQRVRGVYPESEREFCSDKEYYCFLHLTLQEYLAAYCCSLQEKPTETLQTLLKPDRSQQGFPIALRPDPPRSSILSHYQIDSSISKNDHCTVVLFAVGIIKSKMFQALSESIETHYNTQVFSSFHLLYECQSPDLIRQIFSTLEASANDSNLFDLEVPRHDTPLDSFVAGYCIAYSNKSWLLDTAKLNASRMHTNQEHFQALSNGLNMSSDHCIGHIVEIKNVYDGISSLKLLHPHTQKLTKLSIGIPEDSNEAYTDFPAFYPLLKTLKVNTSFSRSYLNTSEVKLIFSISFVSLLEYLPLMRSLKTLYIELSMISELSDADLMQLRKCHTLQHLEITREASSVRYTGFSKCYIPPFAISSKLKSLSISCFALTSDPFKRKNNSLKTLKLCSCDISDDACVALVHFLQSPDCVLETFELYDRHHLQYGIPDKLSEGIGSSRTLKRCVLDRCSGSIVKHLVAGMKKSKSQSRLEELTVICSSYCPEYDYEYFNELIRVVNKHNSITLLNLNDFSEEFVRDHDIRSSLTIHTNCSYTSSS